MDCPSVCQLFSPCQSVTVSVSASRSAVSAHFSDPLFTVMRTGLGQSQAPGYAPLSSVTPGENTRQPTHNKLTTEPAKDPLKKDVCKCYFVMFVTTPTKFLHYSLGIADV